MITTVYFLHETLTPGNVRAVGHEGVHVPRVGEQVNLPHAGYDGAHVVWTVLSAKWLNETAVELLMAGPHGDETGEVSPNEQ